MQPRSHPQHDPRLDALFGTKKANKDESTEHPFTPAQPATNHAPHPRSQPAPRPIRRGGNR